MVAVENPMMVIPERDTVNGFPLYNHGRIYITKCDVLLARSYLMPQQMVQHVPGADEHQVLNQE